MSDLFKRARSYSFEAVVKRLGLLAKMKRVRADGEYAGPCPQCCGVDRLRLNLLKGVFWCRRCDARGAGVVDVVMFTLGLEPKPSAEWIAGGEAEEPRAPKVPVASQTKEDAAESARRMLRVAAEILRETVPLVGHAGENYFSETRGIDVHEIRDVFMHTGALGWNPRVYFKEDGHPLNGKYLGCIVGRMTDPHTAQFTGSISRTFIDADLRKVGKARGLGSSGIVRLSDDVDVLDALHVAEGIETALTVMSHDGLRPMWSLGSAGSIAKLPPLGGVECLTILVERDGAAETAARTCAHAWYQAGREVLFNRPENENDHNDELRKRRMRRAG